MVVLARLDGLRQRRRADDTQQNDAAVIDAGQVYGFVVGDEGVEFLLIRTALATSRLAT